MDTKILRKIFLAGVLTVLTTSGFLAQAAGDAPDLEGSNWQLVQLKVLGGFVFTPDDPGKYVLNFRSENRLTGSSDCNNLGGSWQQEGTNLSFEPFTSTRKLCPPGSLHNNLVLYLRDTAEFEIIDGNMVISTTTEGVALEFEVR